jgi:hypothetical protein
MRQSYRTRNGNVLDLSELSEAERAFFDACYRAYRQGWNGITVGRMVEGSENPLLWPTGGVITRAVWETPLFQAVSDLEARAGVNGGNLKPEPGIDPAPDPLDGSPPPAPARPATGSGAHS